MATQTAAEPVQLVLTRRGSFQVEQTRSDALQCGQQGARTFYYRAEIQCPESALDSRGFLIDQLDVHQFMVDSHQNVPVLGSCEILAIRAARGLANLCPQAQRIRVSIGMSGRAFMRAEYVRR